MRMLCGILRLATLWIVLFAVRPTSAFADTDVALRVTGITLIGSSGGRVWAGTLSIRGCSWRNLGPAPLTESFVVHGTDGDDTIRVAQAQVLFCNRVLQPVAQNGRSIQLFGGAGDDTLYGGGSAPFSGNPNSVFGEAGDDTLFLGPGGVRGEGGPGNDVIFGGDSPGDILIGGAGDDVLCEHADASPLALDGGEGADSSCSATASEGIQGVESVSCTACGAGF